MARVYRHVRDGIAQALAVLDDIVPGDAQAKTKFADATAKIVKLRDDLIVARRRGDDEDAWLERTNGIISALFGLEFPSGGLQWKRLENGRDALRALRDDMIAADPLDSGEAGNDGRIQSP